MVCLAIGVDHWLIVDGGFFLILYPRRQQGCETSI